MKNAILIFSVLTIWSCKRKANQDTLLRFDEAKKIESLNLVRAKLNDSIALKNQRNIFKDLSGTHQLKFSSDETSAITGSVNFVNTGRDLYTVSGTAKSGKNTLTLDGTIKRVSGKHLNFEGKITQNIKGNIFTRTKKTTFFDEGKGNFWRLQDKINGAGFVDYIDIYF